MSSQISPRTLKLVEQQNWNELASKHLEEFLIWLHSPMCQSFVVRHPNQDFEISAIELSGFELSEFICAAGFRFKNVVFTENFIVNRAQIDRSVEFEHCVFKKDYDLSHLKLRGSLELFECDFEGDFSIGQSQISIANIQNINTSETSRFSIDVVNIAADFTLSNSDINSIAEITFMTVAGETFMDENIFLDGLDLLNCKFCKETRITSSYFYDDLTLSSCRFDKYSSFELASFKECVLDISDTSFPSEYPPNLDSVRISYPRSMVWHERILGIAKAPRLHNAFRTLRKYAAQRHSHEEELLFFGMEMRAKRKHDLSYRQPKNWPNLFVNHAYGLASNFGLSVARPSLGIILTFIVSVYFYSGLMFHGPLSRFGQLIESLEAATMAGFLGLFPFFGQASIGRSIIERSICSSDAGAADAQSSCLSQLYWISAVEGLFGFLFIFLLGLALRNIARIK